MSGWCFVAAYFVSRLSTGFPTDAHHELLETHFPIPSFWPAVTFWEDHFGGKPRN